MSVSTSDGYDAHDKKRKVYALLMPMPVPHHISTVHTVSVMHAVFLNCSVVSAIYCMGLMMEKRGESGVRMWYSLAVGYIIIFIYIHIFLLVHIYI